MIDKLTERAVQELFPLMPRREGRALVETMLVGDVTRSDEFKAWAAGVLSGQVKGKAGQGRPRGSLNPVAATDAVRKVMVELSRSRYRRITLKEAIRHIRKHRIPVGCTDGAGLLRYRHWTDAQWDRALRPREAWVRAVTRIPREKHRPFETWSRSFTLRQSELRRLRVAGAFREVDYRQLLRDLAAPRGRRL
jgi:hypothetical protein